MNDDYYMKEALKEANKAILMNEVPVGAIIVKDGTIIARGHNVKENNKNALLHAEIIAITEASKYLGDWRLNGCTMYVTLEPCIMCAGAIIHSRIDTVIFGAFDEKFGGVSSIARLFDISDSNHKPKYVSGVMSDEARELLQDFFEKKRKQS